MKFLGGVMVDGFFVVLLKLVLMMILDMCVLDWIRGTSIVMPGKSNLDQLEHTEYNKAKTTMTNISTRRN